MHGLNRMHCVEAVRTRRREIEFQSKFVEKFFGRLFPDAHRAIALHIAVATHRTQTRTRLAKLSAQQHQIDDLLNIRDRVLVLRQAHGPAEDHALRFDEYTRRVFKLTLLDATLFENVAEMSFAERSFEFFESAGVFLDELAIQDLAGSALFGIENF